VTGTAVVALLAATVLYSLSGTRKDLQGHAAFLWGILLIALILRVSVAIFTYFAYPYGYFAPDEAAYVDHGALLADTPFDLTQLFSGSGWSYFNALIFQIAGPNPLVPRLWNCAIGGLTPVMGYALARKLGAQVGAKITAILLAGFPSLVLWSSLNLKDVDVFCLILASLLLILRLQEAFRWRFALTLAIVLLVLYTLRTFTVMALLIAVGIGLAVSRWPRSYRNRLSALGLAVVVLAVAAILPTAAQQFYQGLNLDALAITRQGFGAGAQSAVDASPGLETLGGSISFLPLGLVNFLFRPFPWESSGSSLQLATIPETILYYAIFPAALIGMSQSVRARLSSAIPLISFLLIIAVGYALVIANLGTAYRERGQFLVVMFVFVGLTGNYRRLDQHQEAQAVVKEVA
jgi:4-amino-4-deoxy-L-arabinose transferase-like glycosyltransferase